MRFWNAPTIIKGKTKNKSTYMVVLGRRVIYTETLLSRNEREGLYAGRVKGRHLRSRKRMYSLKARSLGAWFDEGEKIMWTYTPPTEAVKEIPNNDSIGYWS